MCDIHIFIYKNHRKVPKLINLLGLFKEIPFTVIPSILYHLLLLPWEAGVQLQDVLLVSLPAPTGPISNTNGGLYVCKQADPGLLA